MAGEIIDQGMGLGVLDHAPHLRLEYRWRVQGAGFSQLEERIIRHRRPQEVREPGGELVVVDRIDAVGVAGLVRLEPEDEVG